MNITYLNNLQDRKSRMTLMAVAAVLGLVLVSGTTSASLTAVGQNSTAQTITSGTLNLTFANATAVNETAGFSSTVPISGVLPGDTQYRYITLTQGATQGTATLPTLTLTESGATSLASDDVRGLKFTITNCSLPWTYVSATTSSTCGGTTSVVLSQTGSHTLHTAQALSNFLLTQGSVNYLQIKIDVPVNTANNETTINGGAPTVFNGVQNFTGASLTSGIVSFTTPAIDAAELAAGEYFTVTGFTGTSAGFNTSYHVITSAGTTVTALPINTIAANFTTIAATTATASEPTIQGQSAALTLAFTEQQRAGSIANG
jgi:hypothetical protein